MTDNEIIQALKKVKKQYGVDCYVCKYKHICMYKICPFHACDHALDLINRQKAEIESAKKVAEEAIRNFNRMESLYRIKCVELKVARAEAIKEFVERLCDGRVSNDPVVIAAKCLEKEMTKGRGKWKSRIGLSLR